VSGEDRLASRFVLGVVPLVVFGVFAVAQFAIPLMYRSRIAAPTNSIETALALDSTALPKKCVTVDQTKHSAVERDRDDVFGNYSRTYEYRDSQDNSYLVSCDFPLEPGGHELTICYQGIGWRMTERRLQDAAAESGAAEDWGYAEADFFKPDGMAAFLAFCSFDEYGSRVTPRSYSLWNDLWLALRKELNKSGSMRTFQVQVWTTRAGEIREEQKQVARALLLDARERFRQLVTGGDSAK
jgi:hypothetical protein